MSFLQALALMLTRLWAAFQILSGLQVVGWGVMTGITWQKAPDSATAPITFFQSVGYFAIYVLTGLVLWFLAPRLARAITPDHQASERIDIDNEAVIRLSAVFAAMWMILDAIPHLFGLTVNLIYAYSVSSSSEPISLFSTQWEEIWTVSAKLALAFLLAFRAVDFARLISGAARRAGQLRNAHYDAYGKPEDAE